jgi:hypothetical protein
VVFARSLYFQDLTSDATLLADLDQAPSTKVHDTPKDVGRMLQAVAQSLDGEPQQVIGQVQRPRTNVPLGRVDAVEDNAVAYYEAIRQTIAQRQHNVMTTNKRQAEDDEEHRQAKVKRRQIRNVRGSPVLLPRGTGLMGLQDLNDVSWMYPPPLDEPPAESETTTTYAGQHQSLININHTYVTAVSCPVHGCMLTCHQDTRNRPDRSTFLPGSSGT